MKTEQYLGREISFTYTDGQTRIVNVEKVGENYVTGERTKNGKKEYRSYNLDKMTNIEVVQPDPFFASQYRPLQGDENR